MRQLIEDLAEMGRDGAWQVILALSEYYKTGRKPRGLSGEIRLTFEAIIERGRT